MTYTEAKQNFRNLFGLTDESVSNWIVSLNTGDFPLDAYTVFSSKEAAETFIAGRTIGGNTYYEVYPGATISVVDDPSSSANNGLYHVEYVSTNPIQYQLVKILSENDAVSGEVKVIEKTSSDVTNPCIYFVGVDSSTTPQDTSTFYFNHGIVYDANGGMIVTESDIRLKDINTHLDVDVDSLVELDKVYFSWKDDPNHKQCIGVTAQSVEKRFPELVVNNPDTGYKMVNYAGLSVIALAAIDKLNERYQILENRLNDLENKINNINR